MQFAPHGPRDKGLAQRSFSPAAYDVNDLLPAMRNGLSVDGRLYAAPFYGESSMLTRRADVMQKAGITLPERLTWAQMKEAADEIADPKAGGCSA